MSGLGDQPMVGDSTAKDLFGGVALAPDVSAHGENPMVRRGSGCRIPYLGGVRSWVAGRKQRCKVRSGAAL